jgi:hypothetical protein
VEKVLEVPIGFKSKYKIIMAIGGNSGYLS